MKYNVYCINLVDRQDRYLSAQKTFRDAGINNVKFHRVERNPCGGAYGCYESHIDVIEDSDSDIVIVFEDDVQINTNSSLKWTDVLKYIELYMIQGDVEYMSIANLPMFTTTVNVDGDKHLIKSKFLYCLGYAIKKSKYMNIRDILLNELYITSRKHEPIDVMFLALIKNPIGFRVPFFVQDTCDTDNDWNVGSFRVTSDNFLNYLSASYREDYRGIYGFYLYCINVLLRTMLYLMFKAWIRFVVEKRIGIKKNEPLESDTGIDI